MHHTSCAHCVIPFPSAALPSSTQLQTLPPAVVTVCSCPSFSQSWEILTSLRSHCSCDTLEFLTRVLFYIKTTCVYMYTFKQTGRGVACGLLYDSSLLWSLLKDPRKLALSFRSCQLPCSHQDPWAVNLLSGENHIWFVEVDKKQPVI